MNSPLKLARLSREQTLHQVAEALGIDTGNLSRIERGTQVPSKELAEKLANYFGNGLTEMQIIYPERYVEPEQGTAAEQGA